MYTVSPYVRISESGTEKQPKQKVFGRDIPRTSGRMSGAQNPEDPNLEKIQDLGTRLKISSEIETNDIFKRD